LSEEQKERLKVRARIERVFGCVSQTMKGFCLRCLGKRRNGAAVGFINLICHMARDEQIVRWKLLPPRAA
jgi:hypothetical protein